MTNAVLLSQENYALPREKLLASGVEMLNTEELWRLILGTGSEHVPVKMLAQRIHQKISQKKKLTVDDLCRLKGMGVAKACQVLAAVELVERLRPEGHPLVDSVAKVLTQLGELRYAQREQLIGLYLNARMQLVVKETLSVGSLNATVLSPRDIFAVIKYHPVTQIILAHNHPSGDPEPSPSDFAFTKRVAEAGRILGVELLDHIIIAKEKHYSWKESEVVM